MSSKDSWSPSFDPEKVRVTKTLPTKFPTPAQHETALPSVEVSDYSSSMPVDTGRSEHKAATGNDLQDKIYEFPESYNALRRELHDNYPQLWQHVGYAMAFDAITFIELMDAALDVKTTWDSAKVGAICHRYWNELRAKRGLSKLPYGDGGVTLLVTKG